MLLCAIHAGPQSAGLAAALSKRLRLLEDLGADAALSVRLHGPETPSPNADVIIQVVDPSSVDTFLGALSRWRTSGSRSVCIAVGDESVHPALETFLAAGASEIVFLPSSDDELKTRMRKVLARVTSARRSRRASPDKRLQHVIGSSPDFAKLFARLPTVAGSDIGVLVLGETGTGKEVLAHAVHYLSKRAAGPWVPVNCAAIPIELMESELFGHVRGAFTTALAPRLGLVAEAEGGTLFLDDVDCLPQAAQSKLLRLLQEREYRPIGSNALRRANIRVIAASNRDLAAEVARGAFRQDLFYRLNVFAMSVPPLRDRRDDIPALAAYFVERYAREFGRSTSGLSPAAAHALMRQPWPGNVRELQHVIERAVLLCEFDTLEEADLGLPASDASKASVSKEGAHTFQAAKATIVREFERSYIQSVLAKCGGNVTRAARDAGKNRRAFFALMTKHCIDPGSFRAEPRGS